AIGRLTEASMSLDDRDHRPAGAPRFARPKCRDAAAARLQAFCLLQSMLLALAALLGYLASLQQIAAPLRFGCGVAALLFAGAALSALWRVNNRFNEEWLGAVLPRDRRNRG